MVDKNKLRQKIVFIEENVHELRRLADLPEHEFVAGRLYFHAAVRMLQVAIEAMIDTANHIVAARRLGLPQTYAQTFELLAKGNVIPRSFIETAQRMVRFRNRAVHLYEDLGPEQVYRILQHSLPDFEEFIGFVVQSCFQEEPGR